jgi:hypothetical protein
MRESTFLNILPDPDSSENNIFGCRLRAKERCSSPWIDRAYPEPLLDVLVLLGSFGKPEPDSLTIGLVFSAVPDTQIPFLGHAEVDPHRDIKKGEQNQKGGMN